MTWLVRHPDYMSYIYIYFFTLTILWIFEAILQQHALILRGNLQWRRIRYHLFNKLNIGTMDHCPCGTDKMTLDHIWQDRAIFQDQQECIRLAKKTCQDKLYGSLKDLWWVWYSLIAFMLIFEKVWRSDYFVLIQQPTMQISLCLQGTYDGDDYA